MEPSLIFTDLVLLLAGFAAGTFGALLGIGGGVIVVPVLVIFIKVPIRVAIGTSFIAVLSTSLSAASSYLQSDLCDLETGLSLEVATVLGAIAGAYAAGILDPKVLLLGFSIILFYISISMLLKKKTLEGGAGENGETPGKTMAIAKAASFFAGIVSGSLGVGGGLVKVPVLNRILGFPMARAVATSSYMIGITVASSTIVFTIRGDMDPFLAAPLVAGIFLGARQGAKIMPHLSERALRGSFILLLLYFGLRFFMMGLKKSG